MECEEGSFAYLKYLEFYKTMDKDVLQFLSFKLETCHP